MEKEEKHQNKKKQKGYKQSDNFVYYYLAIKCIREKKFEKHHL